MLHQSMMEDIWLDYDKNMREYLTKQVYLVYMKKSVYKNKSLLTPEPLGMHQLMYKLFSSVVIFSCVIFGMG